MSLSSANSLESRLQLLQERWVRYLAAGDFDLFVEFTIALNSVTEQFNNLRLPGLVRLCEGLENMALGHIADAATHPLAAEQIDALQRQLDALIDSVGSSRPPSGERRIEDGEQTSPESDWIKPRSVWILTADEQAGAAGGLCRQMRFFGFRVLELRRNAPLPAGEGPLAVLFMPAKDATAPDELERIRTIREKCPASQLFYLGVAAAIEPMVALMRAGIDVTIPSADDPATVLNRVLDLVQTFEQEEYRVLVVEDSRVAATMIQRTLDEHGIDSATIDDPGKLLEALDTYSPDLILMDMHMPRFSGVEATRVLRQLPRYQSVPIVYLSASSEIGMQVEALRLGGDQFLTKPFNPVLLAAVVKTTIGRYRETQRSSQLDGLTGLLNHTAAKARLHAMWAAVGKQGSLSVAMIDIDHFKSVNDTYGHPVGDKVIRGLAWLLRGRLRSCDMIGRYGGEEFLVALSDAGDDQVFSIIDDIRRDFAALPHAHAGGALYASFSAGVASGRSYASAAELTEAADNALLQAKRLGRNRVERT